MGRKPAAQQPQVPHTLQMEVETVSSGWLLLDTLVSYWGGFPAGSINVISGVPNSGKTSICVNATIDALQKGWKVIYFDVEGRLVANPQRLLRKGVTPELVREKLLYYPGESIVEKVASIIRGEITASNDYPRLIVIDSLSSMQSLKQFSVLQAGKWEEQGSQLVAALSRGIVEAFKDLFTYYTASKGLIFLLTAQVRANIQPGHFRPTRPAIGYYVLHAAHTHIYLYSYDTKKSEVDESLLGIPLEVKLTGAAEPRTAFRTVVATLEKGQLSPAGSNITIRGLMFQVALPHYDIYLGDFHNCYDILKYGRNPSTQFLKKTAEGYVTPSNKEFTPQRLIESVELRNEVLKECAPLLREKLHAALQSLSRVRKRRETSQEVADDEEDEMTEDEGWDDGG